MIELLIEKLQSNSQIGIIGPKVLGLDNRCQSPHPYISFFKKYIVIPLSSLFLSAKTKRKFFDFDYPEKAKEGFHYMVMGSFFMVRMNDYISCGMMDSNTFMYYE